MNVLRVLLMLMVITIATVRIHRTMNGYQPTPAEYVMAQVIIIAAAIVLVAS